MSEGGEGTGFQQVISKSLRRESSNVIFCILPDQLDSFVGEGFSLYKSVRSPYALVNRSAQDNKGVVGMQADEKNPKVFFRFFKLDQAANVTSGIGKQTSVRKVARMHLTNADTSSSKGINVAELLKTVLDLRDLIHRFDFSLSKNQSEAVLQEYPDVLMAFSHEKLLGRLGFEKVVTIKNGIDTVDFNDKNGPLMLFLTEENITRAKERLDSAVKILNQRLIREDDV